MHNMKTDLLQEEQRDVHEAILRSRADNHSADGVVIARLTGQTAAILTHCLVLKSCKIALRRSSMGQVRLCDESHHGPMACYCSFQ